MCPSIHPTNPIIPARLSHRDMKHGIYTEYTRSMHIHPSRVLRTPYTLQASMDDKNVDFALPTPYGTEHHCYWYCMVCTIPEHPTIPTDKPWFSPRVAVHEQRKEWRTDFGVFWLWILFNRGVGSVVGGGFVVRDSYSVLEIVVRWWGYGCGDIILHYFYKTQQKKPPRVYSK